MKKHVSFICALLLLFSVIPCTASEYSLPYTGAKYVRVFKNSTQVTFTAQPYINEQDRTMVPVNELDKMFTTIISVSVSEPDITVVKELLGQKTNVVLQIGSDVLYCNGEPVQMDTTPVSIDGTIYVPLKFIGDALDFFVHWAEGTNMVTVEAQIAQIFIWNESESTDPAGIRYSMQPTSQILLPTVEEMQQNPIDEETLQQQLLTLPPESFVGITVLYHISSHKVPADLVTALRYLITDELNLRWNYREYCLDEIPPIINSFDDFMNGWFSEQLCALGVGPLYDSTEEVYRFTYIHAFGEPYTIEVTLQQDGTGTLHYAVGDEPASSSSVIILEGDILLTQEQVKLLQDALTEADFWNLPDEIEQRGLDGSEWILEGVKDGTYHAVDRWAPLQEDPVYTIGKLFMEFAGHTQYTKLEEIEWRLTDESP